MSLDVNRTSLGPTAMQKRKFGEASCWFGHVLMPSLSLWTAWHARNSDLIMLFCDMVVAVCICEVVESDFCLSSGFGVLVMCLRITIPFSHVGVASHKSHHMTSQCIM